MIQGGRSGVGRYVTALADALVREQPEVELHVAGVDEDREHFPSLPAGRWVSIPRSMGRAAKNLFWHMRSLPRELKRGGFDVLHIPSYRRMIPFSPVPQVATIHDCAPFILTEKYDALRGFFGRVLVPAIARRVPKIIAVSNTTAGDINLYMKVPQERIRAIPNGIDHDVFRPVEEEVLKGFRERKNITKPYFIYVARLEYPAKNHHRLVEAFGKVVERGDFDGELILPGAPWHGSDVIEALVKKSPHRDRIRLEGFVDADDLPLWYAASEGLVFPSLMEGFGLPLLEAQACGTRVASANGTSLPEVAGPAGILFDGKDVDEMANAMTRLATMDPEERQRREDAGKSWAARFTWSAHARDAVEVYNEVATKECA